MRRKKLIKDSDAVITLHARCEKCGRKDKYRAPSHGKAMDLMIDAGWRLSYPSRFRTIYTCKDCKEKVLWCHT